MPPVARRLETAPGKNTEAALTKLRTQITGPRVVVLEHDHVALFDTCEALEADGFNAVPVADPAKAVDEIESAARIDVLVLSTSFDGAPNAYTLARMARLRRPDVPVVFLG